MHSRSHDEIGELVDAFNRMTESLEQTTVSKDYVNAILTELADALIVFDMQGIIVTVNPGTTDLLDYGEAELLGNSIDLVLSPGEQVVRPAALQAAGGVRNYETTYRRRDGSPVPVLFSAALLTRASGGVLIVSTGRDISARKREEQLREELIAQLRDSMAKIKTLRGLIPICAACKKIRDDQGYWSQIELYIREHSEAEFTHGICPECMSRFYPGLGRK
jgi:PAS domain S-box-containing protein